MKKKHVIIAVLLLIICCGAVFLFPKKMPTQGVLLQNLAAGQSVSAEIDVPVSLSLDMPIENAVITQADISGEINKAAIGEDGRSVVVECGQEGEFELSLTVSAKGYRNAVFSWKVKVNLHKQELTAYLPQGEPLDPGSIVTMAEDAGPLVITLDSNANGADFTVDTSGLGENAMASIEEDTATGLAKLMITASAPGKGEVTITAQADKYQTESMVLPLEIQPRLKMTGGKTQLTLKAGQQAVVEFYCNAPNAAFGASTVQGDAAVQVVGSRITIVGGSKDSTITVTASAPGYAPAESSIAVTVQKAAASHGQQGLKVPAADTSAYSGVISGIVKATNAQRAAAGLPALRHVSAVDTPAMIRAREADTLWSHTRPDGSEFYTVFAQVGLSYPGMGENLFSANSFLSADEVVGYWMESAGHRRNILDERWTGLGVGVYQRGENTYWVQLFVTE